MQRLSESAFVNQDVLAYVEFSGGEGGLEADLVFLGGGNRSLKGEAAKRLHDNLTGEISGTAGTGPQFSNRSVPDIPRLDPLMPLRKKAWFFRRDSSGQVVILAFVNREQSCTVRTFDAKNGKFMAKLAGIGSYRDCFADLIASSIELSVPYQPNLDRTCKERLPEPILMHLLHQIEALDLAKPA
jgi:hypothetical protein